MKFVLPKLPYGYDALEPYIDARTMELHHSKHHQTYVNKLNEALEKHPAVAEAMAGKPDIMGHQHQETINEPTHRNPSSNKHPETGRNDPCPCGSGKKFKKCHGN